MNLMVLNYIVGFVLMLVFAYINTYYVQYSGLLMIAYFIVMGAIMFIFTGKSASKMLKDIEEVRKGKVLLEVGRDEVEKMKIKDMHILTDELKEQGKMTLITMIPFIFMFIILIFNPRSFLMPLAELLTNDKNLINFISYIFFYMLIYVISISSSLFTRFYSKKQKGFLMIPSKYIITDRGIIIDDKSSIKFPIMSNNVSYDNKRKYIEILTSTTQGGATIKSRVRLYYSRPREIYDILMNYCSSE